MRLSGWILGVEPSAAAGSVGADDGGGRVEAIEESPVVELGPAGSVDEVGPRATHEDVVAQTALERVVPGTAVEEVSACSAASLVGDRTCLSLTLAVAQSARASRTRFVPGDRDGIARGHDDVGLVEG